MRRILLLSTFFFEAFLAQARTVVKGQVFSADGNFPKYFLINRFAEPEKFDSIPVNLFGGFNFEIESGVPALYRIQNGNSGFTFFSKGDVDELRLKVQFNNGTIKDAAPEDYREDDAYQVLSTVLQTFDVTLARLLESNQPDSVFAKALIDYNNKLEKFRTDFRGTFAADTLAQMRLIAPSVFTQRNVLSAYRQTFFNRVFFGKGYILSSTPVFNNMIDFCFRALCAELSANEQQKLIAQLMKKASVSRQSYRYVAERLLINTYTGKAENSVIAFCNWFVQNADTVVLKTTLEKVKRLQPSLPGKKVMNITAAECERKKSLMEMVAANRYTLLLFWESSDAASRSALSVVGNLFKEFEAKGFNVFDVSLNEQPQAWKLYLEKHPVAWKDNGIISNPEHPVLKHYYITQLPILILINREGIIEKRVADVREIVKFLREKLN